MINPVLSTQGRTEFDQLIILLFKQEASGAIWSRSTSHLALSGSYRSWQCPQNFCWNREARWQTCTNQGAETQQWVRQALGEPEPAGTAKRLIERLDLFAKIKLWWEIFMMTSEPIVVIAALMIFGLLLNWLLQVFKPTAITALAIVWIVLCLQIFFAIEPATLQQELIHLPEHLGELWQQLVYPQIQALLKRSWFILVEQALISRACLCDTSYQRLIRYLAQFVVFF